MQINKETFEAWLFAQPRERRFIFWQSHPDSIPGCLMCNFFRENFVEPVEAIGFTSFAKTNVLFRRAEGRKEFPCWLMSLIPRDFRSYDDPAFTAGEIQDRWVKLFPQETIQTEPAPQPLKL
jgi:hypothetical protein